MLSPLFRCRWKGPAAPAWPFFAAGVNYPLWWFVAPGPLDPFGLWLTIASGFVALGTIAARWTPGGRRIHLAAIGLASAVTVHFFLLASWNGAPFYYIGSTMAVVTTLLFIRLPKMMLAYVVLVLAL